MKQFAIIGLCLLTLTMMGCKDDDEIAPETRVSAILSGANEVPTNTSPATGTVTGTYDDDSNELDLVITYQQMTPTAWHIHNGAEGANGPVVLDLGSTFTSPYNYSTTLTEQQEEALEDGMYYVNIHSSQYPNGEIRGQLEIIP
jgi:hypothetical protein